jgi:hypothetical protein
MNEGSMKDIKLNKVEINGTTYPIYCDLNVLELIQDNWESINQFERDIIGLVPLRDKDGELLRNEAGELIQERREPRIKAVAFGLFLMIREGQRIAQRDKNDETPLIEKEDIMEGCRESFIALAEAVREEFNRCFEFKKNETNKEDKKSSIT